MRAAGVHADAKGSGQVSAAFSLCEREEHLAFATSEGANLVRAETADEDLIEGLATLRDYWREFEKAVHVFEPPVEAAHEGESEEEWGAWWDAWRRGRSRE